MQAAEKTVGFGRPSRVAWKEENAAELNQLAEKQREAGKAMVANPSPQTKKAYREDLFSLTPADTPMVFVQIPIFFFPL